MNNSKRILIGLLLGATFALSASAFSKTNVYTPGQFTDVPESEWYASEVASTYELGLMNGTGGGLFEPDGNVTVAEAITMASRAASIHAGETIPDAEGEWYQKYVNYATGKGFVVDGQFDNYDRPAKRYEVASLFENAMPDGYFTAQNEVSAIPDVSETLAYSDELLTLYKAGVVMGSDSYGNFFPENNITRAEAAAIINRVALPENRLSKTLDKVSADDAYLLVTGRDASMGNAISGVKSGWLYDGRGGAPKTALVTTYTSLADISEEAGTAFIREFNKTTTGKLNLRTSVTLGTSSYEGAFIEYQNEKGESVYRLKVVDGAWQVLNADGSYTKLMELGKERSFYFNVTLDLDNARAQTIINGESCGTYPLSVSGNAVNVINFRFATDEKGTATLIPGFIKITVNYGIYENFDVLDKQRGAMPDGWTILGEASVENTLLHLEQNSSLQASCDPVSGRIIAEFIVLQPNGEAFEYKVKSGEKVIATVSADEKSYYVNGQKVYEEYVHNLWYRFRLELDTETQKILVKLNGRKVGEVNFAESTTSVDNIVLSNLSQSRISADTFKLYRYVEHDDYVPEPVVPAGEDKYTVGMNACSLWVNELHTGWSTISAHDDLTPVLGYYDEGNPETADWEIKYLVEHGIDFQAFCIYFGISDGAVNIDNERTHLYNGFMNAKYSDMSKFAVLWEAGNGNSPSNFEAFKNSYAPYLIENFFKDDRYMLIDNRPVLCVFGWNDMAKRAGGEGTVKQMFDYLEEEVRKLGYDGMIYLACGSANGTMQAMGFDGSYAYNWGKEGYSLDYNKKSITSSASFKGIHTVPTISVGFNNIGWNGIEARLPMMSYADYAAAQKWVKEDYLPAHETEDWQKNFVMLSTWNEYGEGTYLMPTTGEEGFGYLDALREAYTDEKASDKVNTVPTEAQKTRINRMYPQYRHLLRRDGIENETVNEAELEVVAVADFTKGDGVSKANIESLEFGSEGAKGVSGGDAILSKAISCDLTLDKVSAIRVTTQAAKGEKLQLFFVTDDNPNPSEARSFIWSSSSDEMTEYVIQTSTNANWRGSIAKFRFDPVDGAGKTFTVKSIELLADTKASPKEMLIDGIEAVNFFSPQTSEKGDMLVAFDPREAVDLRLNTFHLWDKDNGVLTVYTKKHTHVYTVGSDTYMLDGKTKSLGYSLPGIDGLPYLPIEKFCEEVGYSFTLSDKNVIEIETDNKWYFDKIAERKVGEWMFDLVGDPDEGWGSNNMSLGPGEGYLSLVSATETDPRMFSALVTMPAEKYTKLTYRVRYDYDKQTRPGETENLTMYFITNTDSNWNEKKTLKIPLPGKSSDGEWLEFSIDTSTNILWADTITQLRFDPFNALGTMDIDYIRFVEDENYVDPAEAPFTLVNADAESERVTFSDTHGTMKIVDDPDRAGNHCYLVTCGDVQIWLYSRQGCTFKPGASYKVSMEVRLYGHGTNTALAPDFKAHFLPNIQYVDPVSGKNDHVIKDFPIKAGDGWTKVEFEFTVPKESQNRVADMFTFYTNPVEDIGVGYYFDNIEVEETLPIE